MELSAEGAASSPASSSAPAAIATPPTARRPPPPPPSGAKPFAPTEMKDLDEEKKKKEELHTVAYYLKQAVLAKDAKATEEMLAKAIGLGMTGELVEQGQALVLETQSGKRTEEIDTLKYFLKQGLDSKNRDMLTISLNKVDSIAAAGHGAGRMNPEFYELVSKARKELVRLDNEEAVTIQVYLKQGIQLKNLEILKSSIDKAAALKNQELVDKELLARAAKTARELDSQHLIQGFLRQARKAKDLEALQGAIAKAESVDMNPDDVEYKKALKALDELQKKARSKKADKIKASNSKSGEVKIELFGAPLAYAVKLSSKPVPTVCHEIIEYLRQHAIKEHGLFRISGNKDNMEFLEKKFSANEAVQLTDIHDASGVLKVYLRKLPEPLIPYSHYPAWVKIGEKKVNDPTRLSGLKELFGKLPEENKALLSYLMGFLHEVAQHSGVNKMTPDNLAIVFAPNLLRPQQESSAYLMVEMNLTISIVMSMISAFPEICI